MAKNTIFSQFTGLYPVSKTLRFELKPVGKTFVFQVVTISPRSFI